MEIVDVQITERRTHAVRQKEYRQSHGAKYRASENARMRKSRADSIPQFIGVDSEGIGRGKNHRAVLLGCGQNQYIAANLDRGLQWREVFEFLYGEFVENPRAAFVGFYLGYDFNQWLRSLPLKAAHSLLSPEGKAARRKSAEQRKKSRQKSYPVRCDGWEMDMLGFKRLSIRPRVCQCLERGDKCEHTQKAWMHICDSGPFFQMAFISVIDPMKWLQDPGGSVCTEAEYKLVLKGKSKRATAHLDEDMKMYNRLENDILSRVMARVARGYAAIGIRVAKDQWYGPGATASKWLRQTGAPSQQSMHDGLMPEWFWEAAHASYYGGWFEIFSHGIIPGLGYNYDINNAYPFAATKLPHICGECRYERGKGEYRGTGNYVLLSCTVSSSGNRIGAMPYRNKDGGILRPAITKGWYWLSEIDASRRAGLVRKVITDEWMEFIPCDHDKPFGDIERLYYERLRVGKNGAQGMAIKLNNNSIYGKFAQSVGNAPYNNWLYASLITSHCRVQILDAIAMHPRKADAVLMVATDGICFDSICNGLPISKKLGEWEETTYDGLVLFKPGVYWHREGKEALLKVKSRGVPRDEFADAVGVVETMFRGVHQERAFPARYFNQKVKDNEGMGTFDFTTERGWPFFYVPVKFRMRSCKEALNQGKWASAGEVMELIYTRQDSDPSVKRRKPFYNRELNRIDTEIHNLPMSDIQTTFHGDSKPIVYKDYGYTLDGDADEGILEAAAILRGHHANYDMPFEDGMVWETVWG